MWARRWLHHRKACRRSSIHPASLFASQAPLPTISPMGCRCERWKMDLQRILWDGIGGDEKTPTTGGRGAAEGEIPQTWKSMQLFGRVPCVQVSKLLFWGFLPQVYLSFLLDEVIQWKYKHQGFSCFCSSHSHFSEESDSPDSSQEWLLYKDLQWKAKLLKKTKSH